MPSKKKKLSAEQVRNERLNHKRIIMRKIRFIRGFFMVAIFSLLGIVLYIKIINGEEYERVAIEQLVTSKTYDKVIKPNRGSILDRYGHSLASSTTVYDCILDVKLFLSDQVKDESREKTLNILNKVLNIPMEELQGYVKDDPSNELREVNYFKVAKGISKELANKIKEENPKCIFWEEDSFRSYPSENFASHLIGFIRANGEKWGIEKQYDGYLTGEEGRSMRLSTDLSESDIKITPPEHGDKVTLTIDKSIQNICENVVNKIGTELSPLSSSIVAMDINTGEILSWAEYPNFDLNKPSNIENINDMILKAEWDTLDDAKKTESLLALWRDSIVSDTFEPGSIYKPIVVSAALEEGAITEDDTFYCGGEKWFGSQRIPCHYTRGHGRQTLQQALANSCNVAMMEIIEKLGYESYYKYQREFGFGEKTGIDLPGEISSANWLNTIEQLKHSVYLATNSMGQGFTVTPIQIINAFSSAINGGNLMKPYIVSKITDKDNNIKLSNTPTLLRKTISKETSELIRNMLTAVLSPSGTGRLAAIEGYSIGGKTGTAQQGRREDNNNAYSFLGYLTADNPQIIVSVIINQPQNKEVQYPSPAPYFREVMLEIIKYKGIKPTGYTNVEDNINFENDAVELPDLKGESLAEAANALNDLGVDYEFVGATGSVVDSMIPLPGVKVQPNSSKVTLYIKRASEKEDLTKVPTVIGFNETYAYQVLKDAGFEPVIEQADYGEVLENITDNPTTFYEIKENTPQDNTNPITEKNIISQMPNADTEVPKGTIIKLKTR